eukprot:TRINITY_DN32345_c0_g1_i1.p1 TRINITY_DN32345_c0_g1~~TRINITY_DN32345_c0_g1_i1.p1  ORF type:complete len:229 (-),score=57.36 TRINITY_DN32345_c0_g1_i1:80-766(-)
MGKRRATMRDKVRAKTTDAAPNDDSAAPMGGEGAENGAADLRAGAGDAAAAPNHLATPRVQRKVVKQMRFLDRLKETQNALGVKAVIGKKKRRSNDGVTLTNFEGLAAALPSVALTEIGSRSAKGRRVLRAPKVLRSKGRQKLMAQETRQFAAVVNNSSFMSNPFSAIQQHLQNTLPPAPPVVVAKANSHKGEKEKSSQKKKRRKREKREKAMDELQNVGAQAMETTF